MNKKIANQINLPTVIVFCDHYLPGYRAGGPIQSIANMIDYLSDRMRFCIITRDRDRGDTEPYQNIISGTWGTVKSSEVLYLNQTQNTMLHISRVMRETPHHVLYLNSFFSYRSTILPLAARLLRLAPNRPLIIAPRGEFSEGALMLKSRRKRMYIAAAKSLGLYRGAMWHASTELEAADIRKIFGTRARISIAADLTAQISSRPTHIARLPGQALRIVFLSRISPMKNLLFALDVLSRVKVPVELSIIGPISDQSYWNKCKLLIDQLPSHIRTNYVGSVRPDQVRTVIASNDLFFLPTLGENFGHAIIEALSAGTPVLISDQTPWQNLQEAGCGWAGSLEKITFFVEKIEIFYHEAEKINMARRDAAFNFARNAMSDNKSYRANVLMFESLIS